MSDLIYRNTVLAEIEEFQIRFNETGDSHERVVHAAAEHCMLVVKAAPAVNRWIPVEDDLPEEDVSVLCYMRIGEIVVMEYGGDGWYCGVTRYNPRAVTHWMPLPELPEKEENKP